MDNTINRNKLNIGLIMKVETEEEVDLEEEATVEEAEVDMDNNSIIDQRVNSINNQAIKKKLK